MAYYYGTNYADYVGSSNWDSGKNVFYMYDGNDTVYAPTTSTNLWFYGMNGNDYFVGSNGNDTALGGDGADSLYGQNGNDYVRGYAGNDLVSGGNGSDTVIGDAGTDYLYGGAGSDHLYGGTGQDFLYGGTGGGYDTFHLVRGESNASGSTADLIVDWNPIYDNIDSTITGTSANYREVATTATNIGAARSQVEASSTLKSMDHVFLYNASTNKGYLLSDLDSNYSFETGVILSGASSASWMSYSDIV